MSISYIGYGMRGFCFMFGWTSYKKTKRNGAYYSWLAVRCWPSAVCKKSFVTRARVVYEYAISRPIL